MMKINFICLILVSGFISANAQSTKKSKPDSAISYFRADASYLSNYVYNGRQDSLKTPYLTPTFGYYDKSGFWISGSLSYLANSANSRIDLYSLDIGYDFDLSDRFSGTVYADKSFYNDASTVINSAVKGSIGSTLSYDLDFLQVNAGIDILFSTKADIATNIGLAHAFYIGDKGNLFTITPTVTTNLSTLHYYEGYANKKAGKKANQVIPNLQSITVETTVNNNQFTLMDYEISLPFTYDSKKIGFFLTPTFAIPKNPINTSTTTTIKLRNGTQTSQTVDSTPWEEKNLTNTFYAEIGFYLKF